VRVRVRVRVGVGVGVRVRVRVRRAVPVVWLEHEESRDQVCRLRRDRALR